MGLSMNGIMGTNLMDFPLTVQNKRFQTTFNNVKIKNYTRNVFIICQIHTI